MNKIIEDIFKSFTVDNVSIPIGFPVYTGKKETYLTYNFYDEPILSGDDECLFTISKVEINIFTKGNYIKIVNEVKKKMKENDFVWTGDSEDLYETDTKYHHKALSFEKEMEVC